MKKRRFSTRNIVLVYTVMIFIVAVGSLAVSLYFSRILKAGHEKKDSYGDVYSSSAVNDGSINFDRYYVMITADRELDFWQSVYKGAFEEGIKKGICVEMMGENLSDDYSDTDLMEIAVASKADGIIIYADESAEMRELIEKAVNEGIPVVTVYGDSANSTRCCYVGVGSYNLGREYGKQVVKIARESELSNTTASTHMNDVVKVAVLVNSYSDNSNQNLVWSGIQNAVSTENNTQTQIELSMAYVDNRSTFTAEESIRDLFRSKETPDVIICLNETDTNCVYQTLIDYNKVGKSTILGYYDSETILKGISRNVIYSTISVDTYQMGVYCVDAIYEYEEKGNTSQYMLADVTLIDKNNVSDYLKEETEVEE
ncbi:MAG: substrate-binding domain-containing protein [Lachnospiraceae bacterium]|nr:substrate-binding domain-containing protein [Lachnospiraceae bacterium]